MAISELVSDEVFGEQEFKKKKPPDFKVHNSEILYTIKYYLGAMVIWYQEFAEPWCSTVHKLQNF